MLTRWHVLCNITNIKIIFGVYGVDIVVGKQKSSLIKRFFPLALTALIAGAGLYYTLFLGQADFSINSNTMVYGEVKQGNFSVSVRGSGVLVPDKIQWLSASVNAHVERVVVKPGKVVKKGELIIELSNPLLQQLLEETQWELEAKIAESTASKVEQQSLMLSQRALMLDAQLNYESSKLKRDAQSILFTKHEGVVSKIDYERTQLETEQFSRRWHIQQEILQTMKANIVAQNNAIDSRLKKMRKTLERAQQKVNDLMIYASIDSVVQEVAVEPGQRVNMGGNLAKLAEQNSLIAELQVPELLIGEVNIGQQVMIDTRNNKVMGVVSRVDPAVVNGSVQVDVKFNDGLPKDARPDLAIDGEIKITEIADTLFVNRPIFAQSQSHTSLYKVSLDGDFASRVNVELGKGSVNQIQVISGLSLGDKIIISDASRWESYQKIRIN